jgi:hypothetical protein
MGLEKVTAFMEMIMLPITKTGVVIPLPLP